MGNENWNSSLNFKQKTQKSRNVIFFLSIYQSSTKEKELLEFLQKKTDDGDVSGNMWNEIIYRSQLSNHFDDFLYTANQLEV